MKQERNTILKNVLTPNSIETRGSWSLAHKDNMVQCPECKSGLFYVRRQWGIVEEMCSLGKNVKIAGYRLGNKYLALREIGFALYCCECGGFEDNYDKWFYNDNQLVCTWDDDELDYAEREEIEQALSVYNHSGQVKANYESSAIVYLRNKIKEYEKKNKIESVTFKPKVRKKNGKNKIKRH